jgi:hypothetical protein
LVLIKHEKYYNIITQYVWSDYSGDRIMRKTL